MNKIITIGREFGSGGRELGRRLAEELGIAYYDREIIAEIAKRTELSEQYVQQIVEHRPLNLRPITIGHSMSPDTHPLMKQNREIDCQRCADYILKDKNPLKIFVYADMASKIARCRLKAPENEHLSDHEMRKQIKRIDRNRAKYYEFYTGRKWGDKLNYDLCINTTNTEIKKIVPRIAKLF